MAVAILTRLNARLRAAAHIDGLTGLLNRGVLRADGPRLEGRVAEKDMGASVTAERE